MVWQLDGDPLPARAVDSVINGGLVELEGEQPMLLEEEGRHWVCTSCQESDLASLVYSSMTE